MSNEAYIYEAIRTPRGRGKKGSLYATKPVDLVVGLIDELRSRLPGLDPGYVDDLVLGVVTPVADQGGNLAKAAALVAGLPDTVGGVQVNRFCASGLEATNLAAQKVRSGWDRLVLAGGVESMSRVPMMSDGGALFTDPTTTYDHYFVPQGIGADLIATIEGFSREDVDAYAVRSQQRADTAWREGRFKRSIVPVTDGNGVTVLDQDEHRRPGSTVESLGTAERPHPVQRAFVDAGAVQCGFCTPGFIVSTVALLRENPEPSDAEIREALAGNICRCTGYGKILEAVHRAASARA